MNIGTEIGEWPEGEEPIRFPPDADRPFMFVEPPLPPIDPKYWEEKP